MAKHTLNELGNMSREELITIILSMQGQLDALNENIEKLIEQVRLANSYRFGRHTETLKSIDGQLSFFDEAETLFDASAQEPSVEEAVVVTRKKKSKGQRELNLKAFPWSSWMPSMGKAAGAGCRMKSIKDCGTSRNPGQWKSIPLRCMSGQMATIRMNL